MNVAPSSPHQGEPNTAVVTHSPQAIRVVDPLVVEISGPKVVMSSPLVKKRWVVGPAIADIILAVQAGKPIDEHPPATIRKLLEVGLLVDGEEAQDEPSAPWDAWGVTAWSFHHRVRDTDFVHTDDLSRVSQYRERLRSRSMPSSFRTPVSNRILLLPRVRCPLTIPFRDVLEGRRTHRHYVDQTLSLDMFSDMLHYTFAPLRFADAGEMGTLQLRACASGGARHETEAFVFVFNVASVRPGLYHYDNLRHGLEPINENAGRDELEHITHEQGFFRNAAFGVLAAAVAERMSWKYPHPMGYRMLMHNVGHMAQVFSMTATALGLGASLTGAIRESVADSLLGLHQPSEFTTFALACGFPARGPDGMPQSIRTSDDAIDHY